MTHELQKQVVEIHRYMTKRAESEDLSHDLELDFYAELFEQGMRNFFGVNLDDVGGLVSDEQNPKFFASYRG